MSDVRTWDREANKTSPGKTGSSGISGFISYRRLCALLESGDEISQGERITHLEFDARGISYRVTLAAPIAAPTR
jgi:hypothetical protein